MAVPEQFEDWVDDVEEFDSDLKEAVKEHLKETYDIDDLDDFAESTAEDQGMTKKEVMQELIETEESELEQILKDTLWEHLDKDAVMDFIIEEALSDSRNWYLSEGFSQIVIEG